MNHILAVLRIASDDRGGATSPVIHPNDYRARECRDAPRVAGLSAKIRQKGGPVNGK